jgi:hypothetical protein
MGKSSISPIHCIKEVVVSPPLLDMMLPQGRRRGGHDLPWEAPRRRSTTPTTTTSRSNGTFPEGGHGAAMKMISHYEDNLYDNASFFGF